MDFSEQVRTSEDRWAAGYSLFKFDTFYRNREGSTCATVYIRFDYRHHPEPSNLDFTYSYEFDDLEDYHTLRIFTSWSF